MCPFYISAIGSQNNKGIEDLGMDVADSLCTKLSVNYMVASDNERLRGIKLLRNCVGNNFPKPHSQGCNSCDSLVNVNFGRAAIELTATGRRHSK